MSSFCCCGTCDDACSNLNIENLPDLHIEDMVGGLWVQAENCCWQKTFRYSATQPVQFSDGGALQIDGWTTVADYNLTLVKRSRMQLAVRGQVRQVDSGGTYPPVDVGDADWRPDGFDIPLPTKPDCPTCVYTGCLSFKETRSDEYMQRWGLRYQADSIVVTIQRILVVCEEDPAKCEYVMSSKLRYKIKPIFGVFLKRIRTGEYTATDCCTAPANINYLEDYPDFSVFESYNFGVGLPGTPDFVDTEFFEVVSTVKLLNLTSKTVNFGPDICLSTCSPSSAFTDFCLGPCQSNCITTEGTGFVYTVWFPEYGMFEPQSMCTSLTPTTVTCTEQYTAGFMCQDLVWILWDDGVTQCFESWMPTPVNCGAISRTKYTFNAIPDSYCSTFGNWLNPFLYPTVVANCIFSLPDPNPCQFSGIFNTQMIANSIQTMTGLTYSASCSGPIERSICLDTPWSVDIL